MKKTMYRVMCGLMMLAITSTIGQTSELLTVPFEQTKILPINEKISTIVIGNPLVADAFLENGQLYIYGRSYGSTSIIAIGLDGKELANYQISVGLVKEKNQVSVYSPDDRYGKIERYVMNCTPECETTSIPWQNSPTADSVMQLNAVRAALGKSSASDLPFRYGLFR